MPVCSRVPVSGRQNGGVWISSTEADPNKALAWICIPLKARQLVPFSVSVPYHSLIPTVKHCAVPSLLRQSLEIWFLAKMLKTLECWETHPPGHNCSQAKGREQLGSPGQQSFPTGWDILFMKNSSHVWTAVQTFTNLLSSNARTLEQLAMPLIPQWIIKLSKERRKLLTKKYA